MAEISKVNDVAWADIAEVAGVAKASIAKMGGTDAPASGPTASANIVHWWKFDDTNGTCADTGNAASTQDATNDGATNTVNGNRTGDTDVINYDGTNDMSYVPVTDVSANILIVGDAIYASVFSLSLWVKVHTGSLANYDIICTSASTTSWYDGIGIYAETATSKLKFWCANVTKSYTNNASIGIIADNDWHHIACVLDVGNTIQQIYLDGVAGTAFGLPVQPLGFKARGALGFANGELYGGYGHMSYWSPIELSDFRIYDIALSAEQITTIANGDWPDA